MGEMQDSEFFSSASYVRIFLSAFVLESSKYAWIIYEF